MKKSTLIICITLTVISITTLSFTNWSNESHSNNTSNCQSIAEINPPTFFYNVDSRFLATITQEQLYNAKTIIDIVPKDAGWEKFKFREVTIRVLPDENTNYVKGKSEILNLDQIKLLNTIDYSTNFIVDTYLKNETPTKYDHYPYYITVVPEKEASYIYGSRAIINYLKNNSQSTIDKIEKGNLKSGKINFTISKRGLITNVNLESSCGYPTVDNKMIGLMNTLPGSWNIATNANGDKVAQTLVFSFGTTGY
jgi:hypothetical protein